MQADAPTREELKVHLTALGLDLDDAGLDQLLPAYGGILSVARRLAGLDLGDVEPAMIFRQARRPEVQR
jgi:hypothetical protein